LAKAGWRDSDGDGVLEKNGVPARFTLLYPAGRQERQALALAVADMVRPLGIRIEPSGKSWDEIMPQAHSMPVVFGWGSHDPLEIAQLYHGSNAGKGFYNTGFYDNPVVNQHLDAAQKSASFEASIPHWKNAMWDGKTGFGMRGDAAWAWLVNLDHVYFVSNCLDIGPRQIEPHGHGLPIAWNLETWKWTCR
jgi:peptide/nickel transport system substrate-binding protein